jgi:hypothetical protein
VGSDPDSQLNWSKNWAPTMDNLLLYVVAVTVRERERERTNKEKKERWLKVCMANK